MDSGTELARSCGRGVLWCGFLRTREGGTLAQLLHRGATTTRTGAELQDAQRSVAALARRHGVNPMTFAKWHGRDEVEDLPTGPRVCSSTRCSRRSRRQRSLHSACRLGCRSMTPSLPSSRQSRPSHEAPSTTASSATASHASPGRPQGQEGPVPAARDQLTLRRHLRCASRAGH